VRSPQQGIFDQGRNSLSTQEPLPERRLIVQTTHERGNRLASEALANIDRQSQFWISQQAVEIKFLEIAPQGIHGAAVQELVTIGARKHEGGGVGREKGIYVAHAKRSRESDINHVPGLENRVQIVC